MPPVLASLGLLSAYLPTALRTLPDVMLAAPSFMPRAFMAQAAVLPMHYPLALTVLLVPACYVLNHLTRNVSWVDRVYTSWPLICSAAIAAWTSFNPAGAPYAGSLPRIALALALQTVWSARLTWHTARRGLYNPFSEDYRYPVMRKMMSPLAFELLHIFLVVVYQPLLIVGFCVPVANMLQLPAALSAGPWPQWSVPFSAVAALLPEHLHSAVPGNTPVLHALDGLLAVAALAIIGLQTAGDNAMYRYQEAKHAVMRTLPPPPPGWPTEDENGWPLPVPCPDEFYPGFPTRGLHAIMRHPNFLGEQLFWLSQGLLAVAASVVPFFPGCLGPPFALSMLFFSSSRITEWITSRKYPAYKDYQQIVGRFLPQETALKWLWTTMRGTRSTLVRRVYGGPSGKLD